MDASSEHLVSTPFSEVHVFSKSRSSQVFFNRPKRRFNNILSLISESDILVNDKVSIDLNDFPDKNSLLAIQLNLDDYIFSVNALLDISDTVFIYELDNNKKQFEVSSSEFWEVIHRITSEKLVIIDATILLISINSKFEESIESLVSVKLKFES